MSSDVSVVLLSLNEPTVGLVRDALGRQTLQPSEVIEVHGVTPFHEAFNRGAARVQTPYFVQCDADMILDPDCLEVLRRHVADDMVCVQGRLMDPWLGSIVGVRLYRTSDCLRFRHEASVQSETLWSNLMGTEGRQVVFAKRDPASGQKPLDVLGRHEPNHDDVGYVFNRYFRLGIKSRDRNQSGIFRRTLDKLRAVDHPLAPMGMAALCHGFLGEERMLVHEPFRASPAFDRAVEALVPRERLQASPREVPKEIRSSGAEQGL